MFRISYFRLPAIIALLLVCASASAQQKFYQQTTPMPAGRQMYGSCILGDFIYLIGGNRLVKDGYTKTVEKAPINPDGTLGQWQYTTPLPKPISYINNTTIPLNDIVYVVAGLDGVTQSCFNTILWTRPDQNGELLPWQESLPYPSRGIHCGAAVATPGYIHLIGGLTSDNIVSQEVWSARVSPDGSISGWEAGMPLPLPLWFHCAGVANGQVWVWSGTRNAVKGEENTLQNLNSQAFFAPILPSGKIGAWSASPSILPQPFYSASCTVVGSYLLSFCPRYEAGRVSNDIWFAQVLPQGLTAWKCLQNDLPSKLYIGLATDYRRRYVYIPGGRIEKEKTDLDPNVYYIKLADSQQTASQSDTANKVETVSAETKTQSYSYAQPSQPNQGMVPGFNPFESVRRTYEKAPRPMAIYFHSPKARSCKEQAQILAQFNAAPYQNKVLLAEVDMIAYPQTAQQYGVFKTPCWLFFDAGGNKIDTKMGVLQLTELDASIRKVAP